MSTLQETSENLLSFCGDKRYSTIEASMASRFFYCPETLFSLIFSLIVPQASETLLINCSIRAALSCFICFVTCP